MPNASFLWIAYERYGQIPEANKWNLIKQYRNELLQRSDWTQLLDAILTTEQRTAWQEYRQVLRDIPQDFTDPDLVEFPDEPN